MSPPGPVAFAGGCARRRRAGQTGQVTTPAPPPERSFASDNWAGVHPRLLAAIERANHGHAMAYGADAVTQRCEAAFRELFGGGVTTLLTYTGTGANIVALGSLLGPAEAVVCRTGAHIEMDETGAPERFLGAKLIDLPAADGKLRPEQLSEVAHLRGDVHHVQPAVVSLTQSSEMGTVYTVDEIGALCDEAHRAGLIVHVDGARLANAVASVGGGVPTLRAMTVGAGVDVVSLGGTKNGALAAEAVVIVDGESAAARRAPYVRKQATQLASKMRFVAAQFCALLDGDLWLDLAGHANAMAARLYELVHDVPGVQLDGRPAVNSLFPVLPAPAIGILRDWSFVWDWDRPKGQVRWMTSWDTTIDDVERFAAGVRDIVGEHN